jgi:hypothetical protein
MECDPKNLVVGLIKLPHLIDVPSRGPLVLAESARKFFYLVPVAGREAVQAGFMGYLLIAEPKRTVTKAFGLPHTALSELDE